MENLLNWETKPVHHTGPTFYIEEAVLETEYGEPPGGN